MEISGAYVTEVRSWKAVVTETDVLAKRQTETITGKNYEQSQIVINRKVHPK